MKTLVQDGKFIGHVDPEMGDIGGLPAGMSVDNGPTAVTADGQEVLASDYRALRKAEYPTVGDQLDALYRSGAFPPEMAAQIKAVKDRFPKSAAADARLGREGKDRH